MSEVYYVYLLTSQKTGKRYIGQTNNLDARLERHNSGEVTSTKLGRPWLMTRFETYITRDKARWREHTLKKNAWLRQQFYDTD